MQRMVILLPAPESCLSRTGIESRDLLVFAPGTDGPRRVLSRAAVLAGPCGRWVRAGRPSAGRGQRPGCRGWQMDADQGEGPVTDRPGAGSYRAIAARCWPASQTVGCTGAGCEYRRSFGPLNFTGVRRGGPDDYRRRGKPPAPAAQEVQHQPAAPEGLAALSPDALSSGNQDMTAEPGSWWPVLLGSLAGQAARMAEADRERAALLAAVGHDLRAPAARRGQGGGQRPALVATSGLPPRTALTCWLPPRSRWTGSPTSRPACWMW